MWFEDLTGFREDQVTDIAAQFTIDGEFLTSAANGRRMRIGRFETPSLGELRARYQALQPTTPGRIQLRQIVTDVTQQHTNPANAGSLFQVASQFNTLEMVSPSITPAQGIDRYENDRTQGPACAIACGAGTIFRNYLVPLGGQIGQTADLQLNCLSDLTAALGIDVAVRNGYAEPTRKQLKRISDVLSDTNPTARNELLGKLRIGLQWDTEVTARNTGHAVTQAYCSALPVFYMSHPPKLWADFARLVLDAAYEATLHAAVLNASSTGNFKVFLTRLGGGAFGNDSAWILDAIRRAVNLFADSPLDVVMVSYGKPNSGIQTLVDSMKS